MIVYALTPAGPNRNVEKLSLESKDFNFFCGTIKADINTSEYFLMAIIALI